MTFDGTYLSDGWADSVQIWNRKCPTPREFPQQKMVNFCPAIIELWMHENGIFLVPVKYTLVCHMPTLAILGRTTHYCVS